MSLFSKQLPIFFEAAHAQRRRRPLSNTTAGKHRCLTGAYVSRRGSVDIRGTQKQTDKQKQAVLEVACSRISLRRERSGTAFRPRERRRS